MHIDTGLLQRMSPEEWEALDKNTDFKAISDDLASEADRVLGDKKEVYVDLAGDTPLARWAKKERAKKNKRKRKMVKESRRRNRS